MVKVCAMLPPLTPPDYGDAVNVASGPRKNGIEESGAVERRGCWESGAREKRGVKGFQEKWRRNKGGVKHKNVSATIFTNNRPPPASGNLNTAFYAALHNNGQCAA